MGTKIRPCGKNSLFTTGSNPNTREAPAIPEKYRRTLDRKVKLKAGILALFRKRQPGIGSCHEPLMKFISCQPRTDPNASFQIGVKERGLESLVHNKKIQAAVLKEMQQAGRVGGLSGIEIIDGVVLADEEWTPQSVSSCDTSFT